MRVTITVEDNGETTEMSVDLDDYKAIPPTLRMLSAVLGGQNILRLRNCWPPCAHGRICQSRAGCPESQAAPTHWLLRVFDLNCLALDDLGCRHDYAALVIEGGLSALHGSKAHLLRQQVQNIDVGFGCATT